MDADRIRRYQPAKQSLAAVEEERRRLERFLNDKLRPICGAKGET